MGRLPSGPGFLIDTTSLGPKLIAMPKHEKRNRVLSFDDVFVQIRPSVLFVKDDTIAEYLYDPISSQIDSERFETPGSDNAFAMTSCRIMAFAFLDGGLAFVENEWGDDGSREAAFEQWVREREASGDDWTEDDFNYEPDSNFEGPPPRSGCYVIGDQAIGHILSLLTSQTHGPLPSGNWPSQRVKPSGMFPKVNVSAVMLANSIQACDWDTFVSG